MKYPVIKLPKVVSRRAKEVSCKSLKLDLR